MLASAFSLAVGTTCPSLTADPGDAPVTGLASSRATAAAWSKALESALLNPMLVAEMINGARGEVEATVVTSLISMLWRFGRSGRLRCCWNHRRNG